VQRCQQLEQEKDQREIYLNNVIQANAKLRQEINDHVKKLKGAY